MLSLSMPMRPLGSAADTAIPTSRGLCSRDFHSSGVKFAFVAMALSSDVRSLFSQTVICWALRHTDVKLAAIARRRALTKKGRRRRRPFVAWLNAGERQPPMQVSAVLGVQT